MLLIRALRSVLLLNRNRLLVTNSSVTSRNISLFVHTPLNSCTVSDIGPDRHLTMPRLKPVGVRTVPTMGSRVRNGVAKSLVTKLKLFPVPIVNVNTTKSITASTVSATPRLAAGIRWKHLSLNVPPVIVGLRLIGSSPSVPTRKT